MNVFLFPLTGRVKTVAFISFRPLFWGERPNQSQFAASPQGERVNWFPFAASPRGE